LVVPGIKGLMNFGRTDSNVDLVGQIHQRFFGG
jgi:hypothetical protein